MVMIILTVIITSIIIIITVTLITLQSQLLVQEVLGLAVLGQKRLKLRRCLSAVGVVHGKDPLHCCCLGLVVVGEYISVV